MAKIQYPGYLLSGIVIWTIRKILGDSKNPAKTTTECKSNNYRKQKNTTTIFFQNRGQISVRFKENYERQRILQRSTYYGNLKPVFNP